jgi:hypothetical protein
VTTAAKRARQKANRAASGRHTGREHVKGERCPSCRPGAVVDPQGLHTPVDVPQRITAADLDQATKRAQAAFWSRGGRRVTSPYPHGGARRRLFRRKSG